MQIKQIYGFFSTLLCTLMPVGCMAFSGFIFADLGSGHVSGYAQTPKGGSLNTTTPLRPQFSEVNIHHDSFYEIGAGISHRDYFLQFYYTHLAPHGSALLDEALLTHAQIIPSEQIFHMNVAYDWYIVALGKSLRLANPRWQVAPLIDFNWLKYGYHFSAYPVQSSRCFTLFNVAIGMKVEYFMNTAFSAYAQGKITLPLSHLKIYTADIGLNYHYASSRRLEWVPTLAVGMMRIDYEDEQQVPNHIRYTNFPYAKLGLQLNFY